MLVGPLVHQLDFAWALQLEYQLEKAWALQLGSSLG